MEDRYTVRRGDRWSGRKDFERKNMYLSYLVSHIHFAWSYVHKGNELLRNITYYNAEENLS